MGRVSVKTVFQYIAAQPRGGQAALKQLRAIIRKAVPAAEEMISYGMPAYKLHGRPLVYFAGWAKHYSLYPASGHTVAAFQADLTPYRVSKGTIQFDYSQPVPKKLIERIVSFRAREVAARQGQ